MHGSMSSTVREVERTKPSAAGEAPFERTRMMDAHMRCHMYRRAFTVEAIAGSGLRCARVSIATRARSGVSMRSGGFMRSGGATRSGVHPWSAHAESQEADGRVTAVEWVQGGAKDVLQTSAVAVNVGQ